MKKLVRLCALLPLLAITNAVAGDDDKVRVLLHEFLADASVESAHQRFWADDLVYTSSSGTRTTKPEIMASFEDVGEEGEGESGPVYSAEDVQLQQYDDVIVVAFKLVATPGENSPADYYFNTGTFLKRDGEWRVVAWQATKIPPVEE